jgi:hypothetical protein
MRKIDKARYILNILFLLGTVVTFVLFIGESGAYKPVGLTAMAFKVMEFFLRFVN